MKVTVFFEAKAGAHIVAQFDEEATYMACLPALEALAESQGYIVTESVGWDRQRLRNHNKGTNMTDAEKIEALISVLKYLIESADRYIEEPSWLAALNADIHLAKTTLKHIEEN